MVKYTLNTYGPDGQQHLIAEEACFEKCFTLLAAIDHSQTYNIKRNDQLIYFRNAEDPQLAHFF